MPYGCTALEPCGGYLLLVYSSASCGGDDYHVWITHAGKASLVAQGSILARVMPVDEKKMETALETACGGVPPLRLYARAYISAAVASRIKPELAESHEPAGWHWVERLEDAPPPSRSLLEKYRERIPVPPRVVSREGTRRLEGCTVSNFNVNYKELLCWSFLADSAGRVQRTRITFRYLWAPDFVIGSDPEPYSWFAAEDLIGSMVSYKEDESRSLAELIGCWVDVFEPWFDTRAGIRDSEQLAARVQFRRVAADPLTRRLYRLSGFDQSDFGALISDCGIDLGSRENRVAAAAAYLQLSRPAETPLPILVQDVEEIKTHIGQWLADRGAACRQEEAVKQMQSPGFLAALGPLRPKLEERGSGWRVEVTILTLDDSAARIERNTVTWKDHVPTLIDVKRLWESPADWLRPCLEQDGPGKEKEGAGPQPDSS